MKPHSDPVRGSEKFNGLWTTHPIIQTDSFSMVESYVLYLLHRKAYEYAAEIASGKSCLDWGCNDGYGMELMRPYVAQIARLDSAEIAILAAPPETHRPSVKYPTIRWQAAALSSWFRCCHKFPSHRTYRRIGDLPFTHLRIPHSGRRSDIYDTE